MDDQDRSMEPLLSEKKEPFRQVKELERPLHHKHSPVRNTPDKSDPEYQIILDNMQDSYFEIDLAGNLTFFNPATADMLGYSMNEMNHQAFNYRRYILPETRPKIFKIFNSVYRTGLPVAIFDSEVVIKSGARRIRELSVALRRDSKQRPIGFRCLARDVTERKLTENALKKKEEELERKSTSLLEFNAALKILLKQRADDKMKFEKSVLLNVRRLIAPYFKTLKENSLTVEQGMCVDMLEASLENITSPFLRNIMSEHLHLTQNEIQVANLIKEGRTTKEIAGFLQVTLKAVEFHRNNIRKQPGLSKTKINLQNYLVSLAKSIPE